MKDIFQEKYNLEDDERWKKVKTSFFKYLKIVTLSFFVPLLVVIALNEGLVLSKIISWLRSSIEFWTIKEYYSLTVLIIITPLIYLYWFYYLLIKNTLLALHEDFFKHWNIEIGNLVATSLIQLNSSSKKERFNIEIVVIYLNKKLSKLPKLLEWVARKLLDQIPFVEFINSYDAKDLENKDKEKIANSITNKINEFEINLIKSLVPNWLKFIIPINIILLIFYANL